MDSTRTVSEIFHEWVLQSSSHGLPNLFRTKNRILNTIWAFVFLGSCGYCFYTIIKSIIEYRKYETNSKTSYFRESEMTFPAVTICNLNSFYYPNNSQLIYALLQGDNSTFIYDNEIEDLSYESYFLSDEDVKHMDDSYGRIKRMVSKIVLYLSLDLSISNEKIKKHLGYSLPDMLLRCSFNKQSCDSSDFTWSWDHNYGSCYTFNSNSNNKRLYKTSRSGSKYGLEMEFLVQIDAVDESTISVDREDIPINNKQGIHVVIHNNSEPYYASEYEIDVPTGFETYIGIKKTLIEKLSQPYSDCISELKPKTDTSKKLFGYMSELNVTRYNSEFCYKMCYQEILINTCNCFDLEIPRIRNASVCFTDTELDCLLYVNSLFSTVQIDKLCNYSCPIECTSIKYDLFDHKSAFPTDSYFKLIMLRNQKLHYSSSSTDFSNSLFFSKSKAEAIAKFSSKMLKVVINYDDLRLVYIQDQPIMTSDTLLGILGGQLGLFIGISFLSFIEIIELLIRFIHFYIYY